MENQENVTKRQLFLKERVEVLTLNELKQTVNARDVGNQSRTRPVAHYEYIEDIMRIIESDGHTAKLEHIYCAKSAGTKIIPKIEEQLGVEKVLDAWILDKVTGKITLPALSNEEVQCCVAFSYHDKGLDLAFGTDVRDCTNMCIYGSNVMHTYGAKKDVSYTRMLEVFKEWAQRFPEMHAKDLEVIAKMKTINISGFEMLRFLGKLMTLAVQANMGKKVVAPLNVTQVGEVIRGIVAQQGDNFYEGPDTTLWNFYNHMTYVMKGDNSDITTLITDIASIGNMMIDEYKLVIE